MTPARRDHAHRDPRALRADRPSVWWRLLRMDWRIDTEHVVALAGLLLAFYLMGSLP